MRSLSVWIWLLLKRLLKKPAFICLLAAMPVLAIAFGLLERETDNKPTVGIVWEDSVRRASNTQAKGRFVEKFQFSRNENFLTQKNVQNEDILPTDWHVRRYGQMQNPTNSVNTFDYRFYDSVDALIWAVKGEDIACGFVIPEDIAAHLTARTWQGKIIAYVGKDETVVQIAKEKLASAFFTIYAEENYVNLIKESAKGTGIPDREIVDFAMTAYETHLADGSTFAFRYEERGQEKTDRTLAQNIAEHNLNGQSPTEHNLSEQSMTTLVSLSQLRGILAVCVFLCGICGLLTDCRDRQNRRFARVVSNQMTTMVNIWIPMIPASFMMLISLHIGSYMLNIREPADGIGSLLQIGTEILRLFIYQLLIILYCSIIRIVLRKREQIAVVIPILTLGSLICSPVWMRLALYLPVFSILEKFFPVTWYMLM